MTGIIMTKTEKCALKQITPSIAKPQDTVDLVNKQNTVIAIHGRHDPCVVTRANVVVRAVTAFALLDLMAEDGYLSF